jgi:PAS domain S-box-containing protein
MKKTFHSDLYKDVFKQSPIGIYTINKDGFIETFNPKMMRLSGAKRLSDIVGLNALTLPSYKKVGLDKFFRKALKGKAFKTEVEYVSYTAKKMSYRKYQGTPIYGKDRKVERVLLMVEDITKDKLLQVEVNNLAKFPAENPHPVMRFSTDGKVVYANEAGERMLKFWKNTTRSQVPTDVKKLIKSSLDTNEMQSKDFQVEDVTMLLDFIAIPDGVYVNVYGRDVTAERAVDRMRYEFVAIASHQLQSPVTALRWSSELLLEMKLESDQKDLATDIHQSASDLSDLVTDLIDVSDRKSVV